MKKLNKINNKLIPVLFLICILFIWQGIVQFGGIEKYILPSPINIGQSLIKEFNVLMPHMFVTILEGIIGFIIAIILAIILAVIMDLIPILKKGLYPLLLVSQTVPIIALAPLFIIWFGFGVLPKIVVVVIVCFFPIVISIVDGIDNVSKEVENHFMLMGASKIQRFIHLKLPSGLINFFSGAKIAATYSIMGAVVGEWLGGEKGLGVYMVRARSAYALDKMFAAILIIVLVSMFLFWIVKLLERLSIPWNKE